MEETAGKIFCSINFWCRVKFSQLLHTGNDISVLNLLVSFYYRSLSIIEEKREKKRLILMHIFLFGEQRQEFI